MKLICSRKFYYFLNLKRHTILSKIIQSHLYTKEVFIFVTEFILTHWVHQSGILVRWLETYQRWRSVEASWKVEV